MTRRRPEFCAQCGGKEIFPTESRARKAIERLLRQRRKAKPNDFALVPYECRHLGPGCWHFGHSQAVETVILTMTKGA